MPVDDKFQRRLRDIAARFHDWSLGYENHAHFTVEDVNGYWQFSAIPVSDTACPFEILIHPNDKVDFLIGAQAYEERTLEPLELVLSLVKAIAVGHVVTRTWRSTNTGAMIKIETIIRLDENSTWCDSDVINHSFNTDAVPMLKFDRYYLPYQR